MCNRCMAVRAVKLADDIAIMIQAKPCHALQDCLGRFGCRACAIRIFDPQKELTATPAGIKPVEKSRSRPADVQIPRW